MRRTSWIAALAAIGIVAGVLPLASVPVDATEAARATIVCINTVLPALPAMPRISSLAPVGTIPSTTRVGTPTTTVPNVILLTPQRQTGAYVVPTITTIPSLPGVTLTAPTLLIPPRPAPGQNRPLLAAELINGATGASVTCY